MRTRVTSTMVVFLVCLVAVACMRSLDGSRIPCTTSDHCPSNYTCVDGYCKHGAGVDGGGSSDATKMGDGPRAERGDSRLDSLIGDAGMGGTSGTGGTTDPGDAGRLASSAPDTSIVTTGGNPRDAGEATSANGGGTLVASGAGGVVGTAGDTMNTGVAGAGGTMATGGVIGTGAKAGAAAGSSTSGGTTTPKGGSSQASGGGASSSSPGGSSVNSSAGGTVSSGGASSSASTCQAKPRDCTSTLDNNCNGIPDNQETSSCACPVNQKRDCRDQYDGIGICKKGSQTCNASTDKTTSSWSECSGFVAPGTEVCDAAGADENCDGRSNENCECVNDTTVLCECGPSTTCINGKKGTCSVSKVTRYRDADGDGYGNSTQPDLKCPDEAGYVDNATDCDDKDKSFHPGASLCSTATQKKSCSSSGVTKMVPCDDGCINNDCRDDGTVGVPGYVSCTSSHALRCLAMDGCNLADGTCGAASDFTLYCDGPNDCPVGQKCWFVSIRSFAQAKCDSTQPEYSDEVCDPKASTCSCAANSEGLYTCQ